MASGLRLDIESPKLGWTDVRLTAPGVELAFTASYTPRDSISDLAHAAMGVIAGVPDQVVTWNGEPTEYDFQFVTEGRRTRLEVYEFPDHRRCWRRVEEPLAVVEEDTIAIARALWRGLCRLKGAETAEEFVESWGHQFPAAIVVRLGDQLRDHIASGD